MRNCRGHFERRLPITRASPSKTTSPPPGLPLSDESAPGTQSAPTNRSRSRDSRNGLGKLQRRGRHRALRFRQSCGGAKPRARSAFRSKLICQRASPNTTNSRIRRRPFDNLPFHGRVIGHEDRRRVDEAGACRSNRRTIHVLDMFDERHKFVARVVRFAVDCYRRPRARRTSSRSRPSRIRA